MEFIYTTVTGAEKLKRLAKRRRKDSGTSLAAALDIVAKEQGYANWKHVTQCLEQSKSVSAASRPLPSRLAEFLSDVASNSPPSIESRAAFERGLVFALDVKHAQEEVMAPDIVECEDAKPLAAADIWKVLVHTAWDDADAPLADRLQGDDLLQLALDDLADYRLFRYAGVESLVSLDDTFARVLGRFFFPPSHVWLNGKFFDMADVHEVRVEGRVVYSSTGPDAAGQRASSYSSPALAGASQASSADAMQSGRPEPSAFDSPFHQEAQSTRNFIPRLDISKLEPGFYEFEVSYDGNEMMAEGGFSSIREAIESAADVTGDIRGYEVAYAGLVVGTYPLEMLRTAAERVAQQAVVTLASLGGDY